MWRRSRGALSRRQVKVAFWLTVVVFLLLTIWVVVRSSDAAKGASHSFSTLSDSEIDSASTDNATSLDEEFDRNEAAHISPPTSEPREPELPVTLQLFRVLEEEPEQR
ncbi:MAG: hypothetical protein MHM6MM_002555 [Cercozoa sp. M6MM]